VLRVDVELDVPEPLQVGDGLDDAARVVRGVPAIVVFEVGDEDDSERVV